MRTYLDTSVLVALLTDDPATPRADAFFRANTSTPVVSDFAAAEFASALSRRVRMRDIDAGSAQAAFSDVDAWIARVADVAELRPDDLAAAAGFLRRLDLTLRTPDALHLALCKRLDVRLATFDEAMKASALALDIVVAPV